MPPGLTNRWDDMTAWHQSMLIAYDQVREHEEGEEMSAMASAGAVRRMF